MLNKSKGPAMWSPRVQSDRMRFSEMWRLMLEQTPNLDFYQEMVTDLLFDKDRVCGVKTSLGLKIFSKSVVLTSGTFLNGLIHIIHLSIFIIILIFKISSNNANNMNKFISLRTENQ